MNKRTLELSQKITELGRLRTSEYNELNAAIKAGELDWQELYTSQRTSLTQMHDITSMMLWKTDDEYYDAFFDMKDLVEMVNAYFEIKNPYKASNKIAYGWKFSLDKGFKGFRPYLYACIRNYLQKNGVEFKTLELQIICSLKDVMKKTGECEYEDWKEVDVY